MSERPTGVPVTVIGGYLGAGKTTLINRLLRADGGVRLAVIVNDFGALNIDADLIASHDGGTYTLTNGCVCCALGDDLGLTLADIVDAPDRVDEVVIEASGVAEPARLTAYVGPWSGTSLRAIVVVADAETIRARSVDKYVGDLVVRQLQAADLIVLNKIDLVEAADAEEVAVWLEQTVPGRPVLMAAHAAVASEVLMLPPQPTTTGRTTPSGGGDHDQTFTAVAVTSTTPWQRAALETLLDTLPPWVVRIKGTVLVDDPTGGQLLQVVGQRWNLSPSDRVGGTELVVVAVGRQADSVEEEVAALFGGLA